MTKEEALKKANIIAEILDNQDTEDLDKQLKEISEEDWEVFVVIMKQVLDLTHKDDKEKALRAGEKYNQAVIRRNI